MVNATAMVVTTMSVDNNAPLLHAKMGNWGRAVGRGLYSYNKLTTHPFPQLPTFACGSRTTLFTAAAAIITLPKRDMIIKATMATDNMVLLLHAKMCSWGMGWVVGLLIYRVQMCTDTLARVVRAVTAERAIQGRAETGGKKT